MDNQKQKSNAKNNMFHPDRTKELQNDWQGYGKMSVYYGLVAPLIILAEILYHVFIG